MTACAGGWSIFAGCTALGYTPFEAAMNLRDVVSLGKKQRIANVLPEQNAFYSAETQFSISSPGYCWKAATLFVTSR
jgi:hypothetical protein